MTTVFKNNNYKYTTGSQRLTFDFFLVIIHFFLSHRFLSYFSFKTLMHKETSRL